MNQPRILIVGGDPSSILLFDKALAEVGKVLFTSSSVEALEITKEKKIDIVFFYAEISGMSGYEFCKELRLTKESSNIPIIFFSAHTDVESEFHSLEVGAVDFISKPISVSVVRTKVKTHLAQKQQNDARNHQLISIYKAISAVNQAMLRLEASSELFPLVCRIAVECGGMLHAWAGVPDMNSGFTPLAQHGRFTDKAFPHLALFEESNMQACCSIRAAYTSSEPAILNDVLNNEPLSYWQSFATSYGIRAISIYPILRGGDSYAVLAVYSDQAGFFDNEIVQLMQEMASNISFALDNLDREALRFNGEAALRRSEEEFRNLFENAGDGIFITDMTGRYLDVNFRGTEMIGYSRKEILERDIFEMVAEHERKRLPAVLQKLKQGEELLSEWEFVRKDGTTFTSEVNARVCSGNKIIGAVRDVSERREIELRERRVTDMYRTLSATNEVILHSQSEEALFNSVCNIAKECGGMSVAWIAVPDISGKIKVSASTAEIDRNYFEILGICTFNNTLQENGPIGSTYRDGKPHAINNIITSRIAAPWRDKALQLGMCSLASFAIRRSMGIYGVLVVGSKCIDAFDNEILQLLDSMAHNISFALDKIDHEKERRIAEAALRNSEAMFRQLADAMPQLVWTANPDGRVDYYNHRHLEYAGITAMQGHCYDWVPAIHPDDIAFTEVAWEHAFRSGSSYQCEHRIQQADGSYSWHISRGVPAKNEQGRIIKWYGTATNIHQLKQAQEALELIEERLHLAQQVARIGTFEWDIHANTVIWSPGLEEIHGLSKGEFAGTWQDWKNRIYADDHAKTERVVQEAMSSGLMEGEWRAVWPDGTLHWLSACGRVIKDEVGRPVRMVGINMDITDKKQSDDLIWRQAHFDGLTGLPNRTMFRDRLLEEMRNAHRKNLPLALIFLDLDGFKDVNDTLGHDKGDELLKEIAIRLKSCVRNSDTVARMGGDEFTIILPGLYEPDSVETAVSKILNLMASPIVLGDEVVYISASLGITFYPSDARDIDELIRNADQAMYAAKQKGKNRCHYFTHALQQAAMMRIRLVNDLRGALEAGQFELLYHPIIELDTGTVQKAEALLRWHHPDLGTINPMEFIPLAEDTRLITEIGNWVFQQAANQAAQWRARYYPDFQVSINISPAQFNDRKEVALPWLEYLQKIDLPSRGIIVEITEDLLLDPSLKVKDQLQTLREAGIEIALDDFGTGYSTLSYLKRFDIDYIKVDRSFVNNITSDSDEAALCEAIVVMAHKLGIKVIAEGIEADEQKYLLVKADCDYGQGYLFSKPISSNSLEELLKTSVFHFQEMLEL